MQDNESYEVFTIKDKKGKIKHVQLCEPCRGHGKAWRLTAEMEPCSVSNTNNRNYLSMWTRTDETCKHCGGKGCLPIKVLPWKRRGA